MSSDLNADEGNAATPDLSAALGFDVLIDAAPQAAAAPEAPDVLEAVEAPVAHPRTRWAAIVWGLFLGGLAFTGIWLISDRDRRAALTDWIMALTPGTIVAVSLLAVGVLLLVSGAVGLIRRGQRRRMRPAA